VGDGECASAELGDAGAVVGDGDRGEGGRQLGDLFDVGQRAGG
jgi:hypothetical protein